MSLSVQDCSEIFEKFGGKMHPLLTVQSFPKVIMNEESVRAAHMRQAYGKSLQATVKKCSYTCFCFIPCRHPDLIEQSLSFKISPEKAVNISTVLAESIQNWAQECTV